MIRLWRAYEHALHVHPVKTAALSAGSLMVLGDSIAQTVIEKKRLSKYDVKRSFRFFFFGTVLALICMDFMLMYNYNLFRLDQLRPDQNNYIEHGPLFSLWYARLASTFGTAKYATVKMVACDQLLFAPPFLAYFLSGMEILKGEGLESIKTKLKDDYPDVMKTNYKIWPAVQTINFTFVPVPYRVLVVNLVAVGWNTYLAWMSEKVHPHEVSDVTMETAQPTTV